MIETMQATLYYVHDPMCSWCWGFEPTRSRLFAALDGRVAVERLVGGLAVDSDLPMPADMRQGLQNTWQQIQEVIPGTRFNYDFWTQCVPRRSTYPANRAVLAARMQAPDFDPQMTLRIQQAYYLEARNPSDDTTLVELAAEIGLDVERFSADLTDPQTHAKLLAEIGRSRALGLDSFPSLALVDGNGDLAHIHLSYTNVDAMLNQVEALME
jgi:putative protein-disulfide isomerase